MEEHEILTDTAELEEEIRESEPSDVLPADDEVNKLRREIEQLRSELEHKKQEEEKATQELEEFHRLFPNVAVREIPAPVWNDLQNGIPLSAAYALYEKKNRMDAIRAEEINRQNAERSSGRAGRGTAGEYFSPDEVRAMSRSEVRANYRKIVESMKTW